MISASRADEVFVQSGDPMDIIELDMVPSRMEYDDDVSSQWHDPLSLSSGSDLLYLTQSGKNGTASVDSSGGPSKRREFDDESR